MHQSVLRRIRLGKEWKENNIKEEGLEARESFEQRFKRPNVKANYITVYFFSKSQKHVTY